MMSYNHKIHTGFQKFRLRLHLEKIDFDLKGGDMGQQERALLQKT